MAQASYINNYFTSMELGKEYHFKIYAYDSSYLHKVVIKCGNNTLTFNRIKGGVETKFTVPTTWGSAMPSTTSMSGTLTLTTYQSNYTTQVGANNIKNTTFKVPSYTPSVSVEITDAVDGIINKFKTYVQNKSKLKVSITGSGVYGSSIKSYKTSIDGVNYGQSTFTSNVITQSGAITITTIATDTRGKTKTVTETINVLPYENPTIYEFVCNRADELGRADSEGKCLNTKYRYKIASCNNLNDRSYSIAYKLKEETNWTTLITGNDYELNENLTTSVEILDTEKSYDIRLAVNDFFTTRYAYFEIGSAFTLLDINKSGKAIAFGKVSEIEEGVEFGMKACFKYGEAPNGSIALEANTNLNNLFDEGYYCIPTETISATLLNKPYTSTATGFIKVLKAGAGGQKIQICIKGDKVNAEIWERHYFSSTGWGSWVCITKGGGKILWSGALQMQESEIATLNELVKEQANGIELVFSRNDGETQDYHFNHAFISKRFIELFDGGGNSFLMTTNASFSVIASKYLYIYNNKIVGHENNAKSGTYNGITYNNSGFVLRYVIGI